jgi:hypothetical protein
MKSKNSFEYSLISPFKYDTPTEAQLTTSKLMFMAPSNNQIMQCSKLKQLYNKALLDFQLKIVSATAGKEIKQQDESENEEQDNPAESIVSVFYSSGADMGEVFQVFKDLICDRRICFLDGGKEELSKSLFDKLSFEDSERCLGEYLHHFLLTSQMKNKKSK